MTRLPVLLLALTAGSPVAAADPYPPLLFSLLSPDGRVVLTMTPRQGQIPGSGTAYDLDGDPVWRVLSYSPAAHLLPDGNRLVLLNRTPGGPDGAWAVALFNKGEPVAEHTLAALGGRPAAEPLGWLAQVDGVSADGKSFALTLADGTICRFDVASGRLADKGKKADLPTDKVDRASALAPAYRQALSARDDANRVNRFGFRVYGRAAASGSGNVLLSPTGVVAALGGLSLLGDDAGAAGISRLLTDRSDDRPPPAADLIRTVMAAVNPGPGPAKRDFSLEFQPDQKDGRLVVAKVPAESVFAGLVSPGERVAAVGGKPVKTPDEFRSAAAGEGDVEVRVAANGGETRDLFFPRRQDTSPVRMDTRAWLRPGLELAPAAAAGLGRLPGFRAERVDFARPAEAAAVINKQVAVGTGGDLPAVFAPADLPPETALVVVNTVRFVAAWEDPFKPDATDKEAKFTLSEGKAVPASLMRRTGYYPYAADPKAGWAAVELPYRGKKFGLVVILPDTQDRLKVVEDALAEAGPGPVFAKLDADLRMVKLALPRFEFDAAPDLAAALTGLGLPPTVAIPAVKTGDPATRVRLTDVRQRTRIRVDEQGSAASAATAVTGGSIGLPPKAVEFRADRPFLFLIRDRASGAVLFAGRLADPRPSSGAAPTPAPPAAKK